MKYFFISALLLCMPYMALAAPLVPECGAGAAGDYSQSAQYLQATSCNFCYLAKLIQNIVNFLVMVSIPISVGLFAWAGILYFTNAGNPKRVSQAHRIFRSVLIGFIITASGWLSVQIVLQTITNADFYRGTSWFDLPCDAYNADRPRDLSIGSLFSSLTSVSPSGQGGTQPGPTGTTGGAGGGPGVTPVEVSTVGPNGLPAPVLVNTSQNDQSLQATYDSVQARYGDQIQTACGGSTIGNCRELVTATIAAESGGNPNAVSPTGARGLMQAMPGSPGSGCASTDTQCQITNGTRYLSQIYQQYPNIPNALAGYNSGPSNGINPNGTKPGLAPSSDCPGLYAWQCGTNPGGLAETRTYVANICRTLTLRGSGCGF